MTLPMLTERGRGYILGQPLPPVLVLSDLAALLHIGATRAWQLEKAGEFAFLELTPKVGKKARYSGKLVQVWIDGEHQAEPARFFGRKTASR